MIKSIFTISIVLTFMFSLAISIFTCNLSSPPKECEYTVLFVNNDLPILGNFVLMEDDTSFWVLNLVDDDEPYLLFYKTVDGPRETETNWIYNISVKEYEIHLSPVVKNNGDISRFPTYVLGRKVCRKL